MALLLGIAYFILLFIYILKKRGFGFCSFVILLNILSFISAYIISSTGMYKYNECISIIPVLIYGLSTTLILYPFYNSKINSIKYIKLYNVKLFDLMVYVYFVIFVILLFVFYRDILFRLLVANFSDLKTDNAPTIYTNLSGLLKYITGLSTFLSEGSYIMILFFFYSICFLNRSIIFNIITIISSFSVFIVGILGADRSRMIYWILIFIALYLIFKPYYNRKQKRFIAIIFLIFGFLIVSYLYMVSVQRFGDSNFGTDNSLLIYAGQPIINFSYLWTSGYNAPKISFHHLFPLLYYITGVKGIGMTEWDTFIYYKTGVHVNIFFSFLGRFVVDMGWVISFFILIAIYVIINIMLRRKNPSTITSFGYLIVFFCLALIPLTGIISYFYAMMQRTFSLMLFVFLARMFNYRIKK